MLRGTGQPDPARQFSWERADASRYARVAAGMKPLFFLSRPRRAKIRHNVAREADPATGAGALWQPDQHMVSHKQLLPFVGRVQGLPCIRAEVSQPPEKRPVGFWKSKVEKKAC